MQSEDIQADDHGEAVTHEHVGIHLKRQRVALGRDLADIAHQTRIPLRHLAAIEEGVHDSLPALPYTIGFVKSYARSVGLDPADCAERFRAETTKTDRTEPMVMLHEPIQDSRVPTRTAAAAGIALLVIAVIVIVALGGSWFAADEPEAVTAGPAVPVQEPAEQIAATTPPAPSPATDTASEPAEATDAQAGPVVISAREDAWVKVYSRSTGRAGPAVFMGVMAAGDRYEVPAGRDDLMLWTGRAGALDITVGGTPSPPLGSPTQTIQDVPLTAENLAARASSGR